EVLDRITDCYDLTGKLHPGNFWIVSRRGRIMPAPLHQIRTVQTGRSYTNQNLSSFRSRRIGYLSNFEVLDTAKFFDVNGFHKFRAHASPCPVSAQAKT